MNEKIDLKDFDIIGIISLNDVDGIEKYVTPVRIDDKIVTYLSRSKEYYNVKSMTELALEREELKNKLTRELTKRNFVILENMLNCSGKVYFKKFEEYITKGKNEKIRFQLQQAEKCLIEDVKNILVLLQNKGLIEIDPCNILPVGDENSAKRSIEMDNKAMLYMFTKSLKMNTDSKKIEILTPGYGSIYLGPFFKAMYGYDFTNILKSKYISESRSLCNDEISSLMSSNRPFNTNKTIVLLDDNIGTGATLSEIKYQLNRSNVNCIISGAVQYNWRNYYRVSIGEKKDIDRFEISDFDIITPFNYAGHKLYKHAIDQLHSSGLEYIEYLKSKSYRKQNCCDLEGSVQRALICAQNTGLVLTDKILLGSNLNNTYSIELLDRYKNGPQQVTNPISKKIIESIIKNMEQLVKEQDVLVTENTFQ